MKLSTLFETAKAAKTAEEQYWVNLTKETTAELRKMFGQVSFSGGYCFHLALAMLLKTRKAGKKNNWIIADDGHAAVYDADADVSIDLDGVHPNEGALMEPAKRTWSSPARFVAGVKSGRPTPKQIEHLEQVLRTYK